MTGHNYKSRREQEFSVGALTASAPIESQSLSCRGHGGYRNKFRFVACLYFKAFVLSVSLIPPELAGTHPSPHTHSQEKWISMASFLSPAARYIWRTSKINAKTSPCTNSTCKCIGRLCYLFLPQLIQILGRNTRTYTMFNSRGLTKAVSVSQTLNKQN